MKKSVLVVVALIAVAVLGLPPVLGGMTRSTFEEQIAKLDANPVIALEVAEYERGWFSSEARVEVSLDENYVAGLSASVPADDGVGAMLSGQFIGVGVDIAHGPITFVDGLYFGLSKIHARLDDSDPTIAMLTEELGIPYAAELHGRVSYLGTFSFSSNIPPIDYIDENGQVRYSGLTVDGVRRGTELSLEMRSDNLMIDVAGNSATFENFRMTSSSTPVNDYLWAGEFDASLESVAVINTLMPNSSTTMSGLGMSGAVELNDTGELFDAEITYTVDALDVPAEDIELTDSRLTISLGNLSVAAVTQYYETLLSFDMENPDVAAMALPNIATSLLENNPTLTFDPVAFTLNGDSLSAALSVRTINGNTPGFDLSNPIMLLGMFEASADLTAAKALVEKLATQAAMAQLGAVDESALPPDQDAESMAQAQVDFMIATFLGQGYIVDDGENYTTEIEYANGEVRVNGTPLPLGALMM